MIDGFYYKETGEEVEDHWDFQTDSDVTVVAKWKHYFYIYFDPGEGSTDKYSPNSPRGIYWNEDDPPLEDVPTAYSSVEGEVFAGWYKDAKLTEKMDFTNYRPTQDETFYAKYNQGVRITLKAGPYGWFSGDRDKTEMVEYVSEEAPLDLNDVYVSYDSEEVYRNGWIYEDNPDTKVENTGAFWSDTPQTLAVKWRNNYKITLDPAGGTIDGKTDSKTSYVYPGNQYYIYDEAEPSEPGKAFIGWKMGDKLLKKYDRFRPGKDVTLTAAYSETWAVTVKAGQDDDCFFSIEDEEGEETQVPEITIYVPKGESVSQALSKYPAPQSKNPDKGFRNAYLIDGEEYEDGTYEDFVPNRDGVVLVALYTDLVQITVNANGGFFYNVDGEKTETMSLSAQAGEKMDVTNTDLFEEPSTDASDLRFTGQYFYDPEMTKPVGKSFRPKEDVKIFAGWTKQVQVTWHSGTGGTFGDGMTKREDPVDINSVFIRTFRNAPEPEANDDTMAFDHWCTDPDLLNPVSNTLTIDRDMDFYASYGDSVPVTFDAGIGTIDGKQKVTINALRHSRGIPRPKTPITDEPSKIFSYWEDADSGYEVDFYDELVEESRTLKAVYEDAFTLVYNSGEGYWDYQSKKPYSEQSETYRLGRNIYPDDHDTPGIL
ncbi:MAG: InlB B-repeat-containing protein, partial [Blautia sp.]|nr:InlB B-repeat-containing protein [Blautia sp.]